MQLTAVATPPCFRARDDENLSVNIWRVKRMARIAPSHRGHERYVPMCSPDAKTVFYIDMSVTVFMKVSIDGGQPDELQRICGLQRGFDVAAMERHCAGTTISKPGANDLPGFS